MRSTAELRILWAPACTPPFARYTLHGGGVVTVDVLVVDALKALNAVLIDWDYRTRRADTGAYNCRQITGGTNYSLHSYGTAIDINWQTNPYGHHLITDMPIGMIEAIEGIRTAGGVQVWRWGGRYSNNKDAMHFEVVASPAELARGIRSTTTNPTPQPPNSEDLDMDEKRLREIVREETERGGNRTIEFLTKVIGSETERGSNRTIEFLTKVIGSAVTQIKGR